MKQNFNNLLFFGIVRDYRHFKKGDSVIIQSSDSLLRRSLHRLFEREKAAMHDHATNIGAELQTVVNKKDIEIKFI